MIANYHGCYSSLPITIRDATHRDTATLEPPGGITRLKFAPSQKKTFTLGTNIQLAKTYCVPALFFHVPECVAVTDFYLLTHFCRSTKL